MTFRLVDSLPQTKLDALRAEKDLWLQHNPNPWRQAQRDEFHRRFGDAVQDWLDAGYGACVLALPEARLCVIGCLTHFEGRRHALHAAVIMPNHVHILIEPMPGESLSSLLKGIKGASARAINRRLKLTGPLWMDESYDHVVRGEDEYAHFQRYIRENPVKAHLNPDQYWLYP